MSLLSICRPAALAENLTLDAPGGFSWWYCDLVDGRGDGAVVIWFFGLPFLPGYQGMHGVPRRHPGVNVAVYRGGRPAFYLLQEHPDATADLAEGRWSWAFGASRLELGWQGGSVALTGRLELDVPGARRAARVALDVHGPASQIAPRDGDARHLWCPIAPSAEGRMVVDTGDGPSLDVSGRAYVDANTSAVSLPDLGVSAWRWGRIAFPEREIVYYAMRGPAGAREEPVVLSFPRKREAACSDGAPIAWGRERRGLYGVPAPDRASFVDPAGARIELEATHLVEDGPFYLRWLVTARCPETGEVGHGVSEQVEVERIDRDWQRPFVRMRRHLAQGDNSMWLPLFSGDRRGRARRLLRHWFGAPSTPGGRP